jgi:FkbM family methyltransferase
MLKGIKSLLVQLMALTPYNVRRRLPLITLDPLDLLLASYWAREESLNIVQVGACDGSTSDPIYQYVKAGSARAILVEPNPFAFERLRRAYAGVPGVTLIQAAIGDRDGEATFYRARQSGKTESEIDWSLQFASLSRAHVKLCGVKDEQIEAITVPCLVLPSLVRQQGMESIDLLQIDAEAFDVSIVRMALQLPVLPGCVNFEHACLPLLERNPLYDSLKADGYLLGYDSWNILAVQTSLLDRMRSEASQALRR